MRSLQARFEKWDAANPDVWNLFERFTEQAVKSGMRKCSAWLIANRIRWETAVETSGEDYKIPNDFIALFSRKYMEKHPEHEGFFVTRESKRF